MSRTQEELERRIEQQREDLAHTVDALQAKLDVKAHAQHRAQEVRRHPAWIGGAVVVAVAIGALVVWRRRR
jgi:C4-dicarboxylate-specific signal transduction histidine kinase